MRAIVITPRLLVALLAAAVALPASAQVIDVVPYQLVGAFGSNNERDTNEGSCDLEFGCISSTGTLCADNSDQGCVLSTVPAGRCTTGNRPDNLWPSKGGECAGTSGFFERGEAKLGNIQENSQGGYPCVTDNPNDDGSPDYAGALAAFSVDLDRDRTQIDALVAVNGPSSMCPDAGICAHKRCSLAPEGTGVIACEDDSDCTGAGTCLQVNDNSANCQAFDPKPSICKSDSSRKCGIDQDCAKTCSGGVHAGAPCETSLLDCKDGVGTNPGDCVPIPNDCILTRCETDLSIACESDVGCGGVCSGGFRDGLECQDSRLDCKEGQTDDICSGGADDGDPCNVDSDCDSDTCVEVPGDCVAVFPDSCSVPANDFEPGVCGGTQARCSDGDPDLAVGGVGLGLCSDIVIIGQIDSSVNCGRNAGADIRSSPRNPGENPFFLYTPQRDPGTGFLGQGVIREVRGTSAVGIQDAADATANTLGIRSISTLGTSAWADAAFSADDVNGALDTIILATSCTPPEKWEVQLPVEGNCAADPGIFCIEDEDCFDVGGSCENLFFCYERKDPNRPELGPALDSIAFIWQRDIVDNEPIPAGLPDIYRDGNGDPVWSTDPLDPTCPPLCGTEYDHTTFEAEAITTLGALDRASGIQLGLDALSGRRAGEGDMVALAATTTVAFINIGDIRCQMGGQDPNNLVLLGTCTSSRVPCDPDSGGICAASESCEACGGTLIRPGDPLQASKGLNPQALPIGYDDRDIDALKLVKHQRLGVLNSSPATVTVSIFVAATTGIAAATSTDNPPCNPSGDRCVLGETPGADPGGVGMRTGGTFATGQVFAHGNQNRSGGPVSWDPENRPGPSANSYVQPGTFAVGPDGIPGCMGNNSPRNNASDACRKRLSRGQETGQQDPGSTQAKWGFCQGGNEGWLPEPAPPCQGQTVFFSCQFPFGNDSGASCGPKVLEFNTGADDPEILMPVVDEGLGVRTDEGPFAPGTPVRFARPVIPDPNAFAPTLHLVGAGTLRDLDLLEGVNNTDVVFKTEVTSCPIDLVNGGPDCFLEDGGGGGICGDEVVDPGEDCDPPGGGGCATGEFCNDQCQCEDQCVDTDGDEVCDNEDNCTEVANPRVASPETWMTLTGGQRDDDADGYGNLCDGKFDTQGTNVGLPDVLELVDSLGKNREAFSCGTSGTDNCARYDLDEGAATNISLPDVNVFIGLLGALPGPKCALCPLP